MFGGVVGDLFYNYCGRSFWLKKIWIYVCGLMMGVLFVVIGILDFYYLFIMVGFIIVMVVFYEVGNGVNFVFVLYVYFYVNGILFGFIGVGGNLGGVVFVIIFCFMDGGSNYVKVFWIIGVCYIVLNLVVCWILLILKG